MKPGQIRSFRSSAAQSLLVRIALAVVALGLRFIPEQPSSYLRPLSLDPNSLVGAGGSVMQVQENDKRGAGGRPDLMAAAMALPSAGRQRACYGKGGEDAAAACC